ncbi:MAG: IS1595 family transposase [Planctomycetes bacterium]|nr:IS1595 family transposase [Planctomycetota bacterium]
MAPPALPTTLIDAVRYFSDVEVCHDYMRHIKWPNGVITCPECDSERIGEIKTRHLLRCKDCRKQFSYKVGTIFEDSSLGLDKWFVAVWVIANCKNGISSHELGRAVGVTQKTAWFMLHRIREAMKTGTFRKLRGTVEVDETFVGGLAANMHKAKREKRITGRGGIDKAIVQGVLERGGMVSTHVVPNTLGSTLRPNVVNRVEIGATVYTDAHGGYTGLWRRFTHATVDHAKEYVRGAVHTNGIENFWSLLKRAIKGTYTHVAPFHLSRYCEEEVFRYNNRKTDDGERFWRVLCGVVGKRLTYRRLCSIDDSGFMGIQ